MWSVTLVEGSVGPGRVACETSIVEGSSLSRKRHNKFAPAIIFRLVRPTHCAALAHAIKPPSSLLMQCTTEIRTRVDGLAYVDDSKLRMQVNNAWQEKRKAVEAQDKDEAEVARLKAEVAKVEAARQARSDSMGGAKGAQTAVRQSFKELLGTQEVCEGRSNRWLLPSHSPGCC